MRQSVQDPAEIVADALEQYAKRGQFRGFGRAGVKGGKTFFRVHWHHDRVFDIIYDGQKNSLAFQRFLPNVHASSAMYAELKRFIKARRSPNIPEHRRVDPAKAQLRPYNRGGHVSLGITIRDGDLHYAVRKLIHLVHEIFLDFLHDGRYYQYMIENFNLDPDKN